jgi:hypothetical protein
MKTYKCMERRGVASSLISLLHVIDKLTNLPLINYVQTSSASRVHGPMIRKTQSSRLRGLDAVIMTEITAPMWSIKSLCICN